MSQTKLQDKYFKVIPICIRLCICYILKRGKQRYIYIYFFFHFSENECRLGKESMAQHIVDAEVKLRSSDNHQVKSSMLKFIINAIEKYF